MDISRHLSNHNTLGDSGLDSGSLASELEWDLLLLSSESDAELLSSESLELLSDVGDMAAMTGGRFVNTACPGDLKR